MRHAYVSGDPALDLAGTLKWRRTRPEELLGSAEDLRDWLAGVGLVDEVPTPTGEDLAAALALREAVYAAVVARLSGAALPHRAVDHLNAVAAGPHPAHRIVDGALHRAGGVDAVLAHLAHGAVVAVAGPDAALLRECAREECTRVFLDRSRGARRRWCGMEECGGQQKMAAYRRRRREHGEVAGVLTEVFDATGGALTEQELEQAQRRLSDAEQR